jgi:hypothetical protein
VLAYATSYAAAGWSVFPLEKGGKRPATRHWRDDATTDLQRIERWWTTSPDANIAVVTGKLLVVDVDCKGDVDGWEQWFTLVDEHAETYPDTWEVHTPSGGGHFYFTTNIELGNSVSKLAPAIDIRGLGGYVAAPPSRTDVGAYTLERRLPVAPLPRWLLELLNPPVSRPGTRLDSSLRATQRPVFGRSTGYGARALAEEIAKVRSAVETTRNQTLNESAFALGQLVASGDLEASQVVGELLTAALAAGLSESEASATIRSGVRGGLAKPRKELV